MRFKGWVVGSGRAGEGGEREQRGDFRSLAVPQGSGIRQYILQISPALPAELRQNQTAIFSVSGMSVELQVGGACECSIPESSMPLEPGMRNCG